MSHETENKQCQICKGYLFEDDDIVICPECGAPHHRDCWQTVGHCGLIDDHGTERQYDKVKAEEQKATAEGDEKVCPSCGKTAKTEGAEFCPYCGKLYSGEPQHQHQNQGFPGGRNVFVGGIPYAPNSYGGIPKDSKIEDLKVEHVAKFVGSNAHRYIPKFATLNKHNKTSWNWAAFLFPSCWCFSRKMHLTGLMYFIILLAASLSAIPFTAFVEQFYVEGMTTTEVYTAAFENISKLDLWTGILAGVNVVLSIGPRVICGMTGDWVYRGFTFGKVRKILADPEVEDVDMTLMRSGSINLFLMIIIFYAQQYLPSIIGDFIW